MTDLAGSPNLSGREPITSPSTGVTPGKRGLFFSSAVLLCLILAGALAMDWRQQRASYDGEYETYYRANILTAPHGSPKPIHFSRIYPDMDCWSWMQQAREVFAGKQFRFRFVDYDNAPYGRAQYWGALFAWLIAGVSRVGALFFAPADALVWGGDWIGPILRVAGTFLIFFGALRRGANALVALLCAMLFLAPDNNITWDFAFGRPDHQSLHDLLITATLVCFANAIGRDLITQKRWMWGAAFASALGFWVGATLQGTIVAAMGIAGTVTGLLGRSREEYRLLSPESWRVWGRWGAGLAVALYVLEQFPAFPMRLEVNHPLYALAWFCGAELVAQLSRERLRAIPIAACLLGIGILPAAILGGGADWYMLWDPDLAANNAATMEIKPYLELASQSGYWRDALIDFGPLAGGGMVLYLLLRKNRSSKILLPICIVLFVLIGITMNMTRWIVPVQIASCVLFLTGVPLLPGRRQLLVIVTALAFALWPFLFHLQDITHSTPAKAVSSTPGDAVAEGYIAAAMAQLAPEADRTVMNSPDSQLQYLCEAVHAKLTATPYWENMPGIKAAAEFFSATNWEAARKIAAARKTRFIVLRPDEQYLQRMGERLGTVSPDLLRSTVFCRLAQEHLQLPPWLRPIKFPDTAAMRASRLRLFEINPAALNTAGTPTKTGNK